MKKIIRKFSSIALIAVFALSPLNTVQAAGSLTSVTIGAQSAALTAGTAGTVNFNPAIINGTGNTGAAQLIFSITGLPSGATATFTPNNQTNVNLNSGPYNSTLSISTTAVTPAGSFPFTVTAATSGSSNVQ